MSKKLLHKTLKAYTLFSVLMMLAIAPVFYFVTEQLYLSDAEEALYIRKNEVVQLCDSILKQSDIPKWNAFNKDAKIESNKSIQKDSLFYTYYYDSLNAENEPYRELNAPIFIEGTPYTFVARINLVETEDLIASIAGLFVALTILLLMGLYFITKKLSIKLWKPFYQTLHKIEQFEIDKSNQPELVTSNTEEFNRLNQSIQNLIHKNTSIYHTQREFIENAAHELQTPLAVFQAKIDTLIQNPDTTEAQFKELNSLNENVAKLTRLNKNLLLLSKLENDGYSEKKVISFNQIIEKNIGFFTEQAQSKNIDINLVFEEDFKVNANPILAEILLSNLILNAIRHNEPNGMVYIKISSKEFNIANTGAPTSLNTEKLFSRFSKANTSKDGNGLGLAIVKKIADLNHWNIQYTFTDSLHTFSISLPSF